MAPGASGLGNEPEVGSSSPGKAALTPTGMCVDLHLRAYLREATN